MMSSEENKRRFDAEQQIRFVQDREELISFVRELCAASNLSSDFVNSFIVRLDRLVDLGRYLNVKDTYIDDLQNKRKAEEKIFDGVNLNALD